MIFNPKDKATAASRGGTFHPHTIVVSRVHPIGELEAISLQMGTENGTRPEISMDFSREDAIALAAYILSVAKDK